eukprot:6703498-Prymnesium_polylepis.3
MLLTGLILVLALPRLPPRLQPAVERLQPTVERWQQRIQPAVERVAELPAELREVQDSEVLVGPPILESEEERRQREGARARQFAQEIVYSAIVPPVLAFLLWPNLEVIGDALFAGNSPAVDGTRFSSGVLAPTINGVVVPFLAIGLGSLVATTISTLRER